jgi:hypothetical protein
MVEGSMSWMSQGLLCAAAVFTTAAHAAAAQAPQFAPNPAVGWIAMYNEFQPPASGAGPVRQDPANPRVTNDEYRRTGRQPTLAIADLSNPILQPWTREELRKHNELARAGKALGRGASCLPVGTPAFDLHVIHPIFFVQAPDRVLMIWQGDHDVREIYLTDKHSANPKPSWSGESIGHYEGDELVVDTIGITTDSYVDNYFTPHTDKLHVIERFRVTDGGNRLEARIHVEDPGAFTMPWDAVERYRRVEPGRAENDVPFSPVSSSTIAGPLIEVSCAENPFSYFGDQDREIPHADKADF